MLLKEKRKQEPLCLAEISAACDAALSEALATCCRYATVQDTYPWYSNITRRRLEILMRKKIEPDFDKATEYFYAMLGYLDALKNIQNELR